jgi:branched-chain amino acid transport system ATP-binding protein
VLRADHVSAGYSAVPVLRDVSITVDAGRFVAIVGPNGAGKTTLFNLITGIYRPSSGDIRFKRESISGLRPNRVAALGIARTFQNIRLFKNLTVLENVRVAFDSQLHYSPFAAFFALPRQARDERRSIEESLRLLRPFGLAEQADSLAGELSYGSQRRLEIARALALKPGLLLLDEPAAGMNTAETATLTEFLRWVREEFRLTLVLIEHHMHLVMNLCDRITVLDFGQTIAEGTPKEIRDNPRVIEAYLGETE